MSTLSYFAYQRINPHVGVTDEAFAPMVDAWLAKHTKPLLDSDALESLRADIVQEHRDARQLFIDMRF